MIKVLQKYIFKELLRVFVLASVALTCMLGFGGGLVDLLRTSGITAREMVKLLLYMVPIVLAYSLPVSALFSTTITYGRLASDNEINACRAGGINIYKLFFPAIFLSIIVFTTTFTLENYAIPNLARRIEALMSRDLQGVLYNKLKSKGYAAYMNYALHCGRVDAIEQPELLPDGTVSDGQIQLSHVAFLRHERGMPVFYGTARTALIMFKTVNNVRTVDISLNQIRAFDEQKGQMIQAEFYPIGPFSMSTKLLRKRLKFLSLPELKQIVKDPANFGPLANAIRSLENTFRTSLVYEILSDQLDTKGQITLSDHKGKYTITADSYRQNPNDGRIILEGDVTVVNQLKSGGYRKFFATDAVIRADGQPLKINIRIENVKVTDSRDVDPDRVVRHNSFTLGGIYCPKELDERVKSVSVEELIDPESKFDYNLRLTDKRIKAGELRSTIIHRAIAEIHSRLAYSTSALVLLVLGAGLGIIFRGGHFVSAFGLSFIPMLLVVILIMTGKQLCGAGFGGVGVLTIWFGVFIVGLANIVVLGKFLKR